MTDVFSKQKRASIMSANRGSGNRSTERRLRARLVAAGISGWRVNAKDLLGKPDFAFDQEKVVVFVDGCFWHGCTHCRNIPATNRLFWKRKIEGNRRRDAMISSKLRKDGWSVLRFWEHQIRREPDRCLRRVKARLEQ